MWQTHTEPSYYIDHFHDSVLQTQIAIHIHFIAQRTYICRMTLFNLKVSRPVAEAGEPKHRQQDSWGTWTAGGKSATADVLMIVAGQVQASIQEKETYRKELILAKEKVEIL